MHCNDFSNVTPFLTVISILYRTLSGVYSCSNLKKPIAKLKINIYFKTLRNITY